MIDFIKNKSNELEPYLIEIRRYLHKNPELAGQEFNTATFVYKTLLDAGIEANLIKTESGPAVVGKIIVDEAFDTIAFRADMDGLPIEDKIDKPYCSVNCGVTHACGHDFNITTVLGIALLLASIKNKLEVNIKFIFQPSEETTKGGAIGLIKVGVMDDVKAIWTVHALPDIPAGKIGIKYGAITAGVDGFKITVKGIAGHSARPHLAVDSIYIASQIINSLYAEIQRAFDPVNPVVFSVGKIEGGCAPNVIAGSCKIEGTVRTLDENIKRTLPDFIKQKVNKIAESYGAKIEFEWDSGAPPVINDMSITEITEKSAENIIGDDNIVKIQKPSMGAEDFSRYLEYAPGMLVRIGTGGKDCSYPLHSCNFDIDERAIVVAVKVLSLTAINYFKNRALQTEHVSL